MKNIRRSGLEVGVDHLLFLEEEGLLVLLLLAQVGVSEGVGGGLLEGLERVP